MIKFNFTFKIIKSKPKKYSLIKRAPLFKGKSKVLRGQKRKAQTKQHGQENGSHMACLLSKKAPTFSCKSKALRG